MVKENIYGHQARLSWLLERIHQSDRVIELGCGTGYMITLPISMQGIDVVGLDVDAKSISYGRKLFKQYDCDENRLRQQELRELEYKPDVIIASEVLEHVPTEDLGDLLHQLHEKLPESGRLLVTVPNGYGWFELESFLWFKVGVGTAFGGFVERALSFLVHKVLRQKTDDDHPSSLSQSPHVQRFTLKSIQNLLEESGFSVVSAEGSVLIAGPFSNLLLSWVGPIVSANRWIGKRVPRVASGFFVECIRKPVSAVTHDTKKSESSVDKSGLVIVRGGSTNRDDLANLQKVDFLEIRDEVLSGAFVKRLFRYRCSYLHAYYNGSLSKPVNSLLLLRLTSFWNCYLVDDFEGKLEISFKTLVEYMGRLFRDFVSKGALLREINTEVAAIASAGRIASDRAGLNLKASPLYLRTDLWFGIRAGGSVGHISGVLNNLGKWAGPPIFFTTDKIPTVKPEIETYRLGIEGRFWDFRELPSFYFNKIWANEILGACRGRSISFIYQRYSLNNYSGIQVSRELGVPFVLEYNGSEVWISKNWGVQLKHESLSLQIEYANLESANLVVVVSKVLKEGLIGQGVDPNKILINPNGVDPDRYSPDICGDEVREKLNLSGKTVVGFIGTFGKWHGAEFLVDAFARFLQRNPKLRNDTILLLVGDGLMMPEVKKRIKANSIGENVICAGIVPQDEAPEFLAACDVLVSPHVPNPDGTPFLGSPTKLFEYMAMGKAIVASDLDQIGEILEHEKTAIKVTPGDADAFANGIATVVENVELRKRLGKNARKQVIKNHTWELHTQRIIEKLWELYADPVSETKGRLKSIS